MAMAMAAAAAADKNAARATPPRPPTPTTASTHAAAEPHGAARVESAQRTKAQQRQQRPLLRTVTRRLVSGAVPSHAGGAAERPGARSRMTPLRQTLSPSARAPPAAPAKAGTEHDNAAHGSATKRRRPQVPPCGFRKSATTLGSSPGKRDAAGREPLRRQLTCSRAASLHHHLRAVANSPPEKRQFSAALLRQATPTTGAAMALSPASKKAAILAKPGSRATAAGKKNATPCENAAGAMDLLRRPPSLKPRSHGTPTAAPRGNATSLRPWYIRLTSASAHVAPATKQCERSATAKALPTPTRKPRVALRTASAPCLPQPTRRLQRTHTSDRPAGATRDAASSSLHTAVVPAPRTRVSRTNSAPSRVGGRGGAAQEGRRRTPTPPLARARAAVHGGAVPFSAFDRRGGGAGRRTSSLHLRAPGEEDQLQRQRKTQKGAKDGRDAVGEGGAAQQKPVLRKAPLPIRGTNSTLCREASTRAKERQRIRQEHERLAAEVPHLSQETWLAMRRELQRLVEVRSKRTGAVLESHAEAPHQGGERDRRREGIRKNPTVGGMAMPARPGGGILQHAGTAGDAVATEPARSLEGATGSRTGAPDGPCNTGAGQEVEVVVAVAEGGFSSPHRGSGAARARPKLVAGADKNFRSPPRHRRLSPTAVHGEGAAAGAHTAPPHGRRGSGVDDDDDEDEEEAAKLRGSGSCGSGASPSIRAPSALLDDAGAASASSTPWLRRGDAAASDDDAASPSVLPPQRRNSPTSTRRRSVRRRAKAPVLNFCRTRSTPRRSYSATSPVRRHRGVWDRSNSKRFAASRNARGGGRGDGVVVLSSDMLVALYATIHGTADGNSGGGGGGGGPCAQRRGRRSLPHLPTARTLNYEDSASTRMTTTTTKAVAVAPISAGWKLRGQSAR
ncbi:uncharacterized protein Tco025E_05270 [Trypanosoma conorhini]|uniref:Uncharacterized protein n=1 Tax=Trypanosoma conorhini TaxID=83891 RepID=A0A422PEK0_9TRYP|nr:uncharacterized protein Tco025E_05270 [Trypanosoma conorhini]RNF16136.1 hypothetical protein Tco025E_05270 [Trypanosoma conorhini]